MTLETGYVKLRARYEYRVEQAKNNYRRSGMKRDKDHLDYLESRLKRYIL